MDYEAIRRAFSEEFETDIDLDAIIMWIEARMPIIKAANDLLEAVRATEWGAGPNKDRCPVCLGFPTVGHNSRCTVGKALAMAAGGAL